MPLQRKPSADETRERRLQVFRYQMRGMKLSAIARELSVNKKTILRDAAWLKLHHREHALDADTYAEIGKSMFKLQEIEREAFFQFHEVEDPLAKNKFLMTALSAIKDRIKIMFDAGIIDRVATAVNVSVDYKKMTTEELLKAKEDSINRLRNLGFNGGN